MKHPLYLAIVWHMHQPCYKDPLTNKITMPWVRLHGVKDYADMAEILKAYPDIHQTFNLVPSLVDQIEDYSEGRQVNDIFWERSFKDAADLNPEDKRFILDNFFMANWENMIKPYYRYYELLLKRGRTSREKSADVVGRFNEQDLRDLQVWFNLAWIDPMHVENRSHLKELVKKARDFSEEDKKVVLNAHLQILKTIVPLYKSMQDAGQIEVSVTPYYHPILPLVCNTDIAQVALPQMKLPKHHFKHPEDASQQVADAITHYKKRFNCRPRGMWPSEGSVSEEMAAILIEKKLSWMATDEAILLNSLGAEREGRLIYKPYCLKRDNGSINIIFRDHSLSDLIGFSYSQMPAEKAADDFIGHLRRIAEYFPGHDAPALVSVILDGENAWEYFPDDGHGFLNELYSKISREKNIKAVTVSEFLEKYPPRENINKLFPGSWINGNFAIWIGHKDKNLAWDYLYEARGALEEYGRSPGADKEKITLAWQEIYICEGSDWNWWYGDDHSSDNDEEFDRIYRSHLANVYKIIGYPAPAALEIPLISEAFAPQIEPVAFIHPVIDGMDTNYYEWRDAGICDIAKSGGTMHKTESVVNRLYYGFDQERLFLRLDLNISAELKDGLKIGFIFLPQDLRLEFSGESFAQAEFFLKNKKQDLPTGIKAAYSRVFELAITLEALGVAAGDEMKVLLLIASNDTIIEKVPAHGAVNIKVPPPDFGAEQWSAI